MGYFNNELLLGPSSYSVLWTTSKPVFYFSTAGSKMNKRRLLVNLILSWNIVWTLLSSSYHIINWIHVFFHRKIIFKASSLQCSNDYPMSININTTHLLKPCLSLHSSAASHLYLWWMHSPSEVNQCEVSWVKLIHVKLRHSLHNN